MPNTESLKQVAIGLGAIIGHYRVLKQDKLTPNA